MTIRLLRVFSKTVGVGLILLLGTVLVSAAVDTPHFRRVMVVVLENQEFDAAIEQPFFKSLIRRGALLTDYHAVGHPSQPNYVALVAGSTFGIQDDANHDLDGRHLGDLLEAKGKSWKCYVEAYPGNGYLGRYQGTYWRKHEPFISFKNMQDPARANAHIVSANQLPADIKSGQLPDYSLFIPDENNDGHDTTAVYADQWLARTFGPKLHDPAFMDGMLFLVTYDESNLYLGTNHIATVVVGDSVKPGSVSNHFYYHYSVVRTIEDAWQLGTLGQEDANSPPFMDIWR